MVTKLFSRCLTFAASALFVMLPAQGESLQLPKASMALKGLKEVKVLVAMTDDAKRGLRTAGYSPGSIESDLISLTKKRLAELDVTVEAVSENFKRDLDDTTLALIVDTDLATGYYSQELNLDELVTIVRSPETKLVLTTWTRSQHPKGNEGPSIKAAADDMLDQFIADYLEANPRSK